MTPDPLDQPEFYEGILAKRLLAWVVDSILIVGLCLVVLPFTAFTGIFFFPLLILMMSFIYRVATLANGSATLGMRLFGMELRDGQDRPFDGSTAFLHTLGYSVSVAMAPMQLISIVLMVTSARRQGLTDMVLNTVALNRRK